MNARAAAHLALIAMSLYFVVDAAMAVVGHALAPVAAAPAPRRKAEPAPADEQAIPSSRIVTRNLFGEAALPAKPRAEQAPEPVKREIGLDLVGTIVADNDVGLAAILFDRAGKAQDFYRVGQAVRPGVTLKSVQRKSAVLATGQGDVLLTMGDDARPGPAPAGPAEPEQPPAFALSRQTIEDSVRNIGQVMQQARIERVSRGGVNGYRVTDIQNGSVFERLNLRNGDIVTGLNGQEISDPSQFTELYNSLAQHENISVNLYRRGRKHDLTFSLQ